VTHDFLPKAIRGLIGLLTREWRSKLLIYYISGVVAMKRPPMHRKLKHSEGQFLFLGFRMCQHDYLHTLPVCRIVYAYTCLQG
jgi:hypothetical protein